MFSEVNFDDVAVATDKFCSYDTLCATEADLLVIDNVTFVQNLFALSLLEILFYSNSIRTLHAYDVTAHFQSSKQ
jgi:hypothetical protein